MHDQRSDSGVPNLLKKLGAMTAIRDTHMVEQSLLRTLGPILGVLETSFYRLVDDSDEILRALYHSRKAVDQDGAKRIVDNIEEVSHERNIPDYLRNLFDSVRLLRKSCSRKRGIDLITCYPIYGKNELVGYFVFQRDREVTPVEDAIIQGVLEVFTNYFDLLDTSQRDQLTGLYNRYSLELNLDRLWNVLSSRLHHSETSNVNRTTPETYWLAVLDIDHFKTINDNFGHMIGDEVLIMVTRLLQNSFRYSDLLYRHGGEEFIAIIAANDLPSATQVFERARIKIERFLFPQVGHITISGGFSCADPSVLPQEIINRADRALYLAKKQGRNRIYHYDTLIKEGILKSVETGSIDLF
ncbi:MAG: GGDEF domain-containing protein [Methylomicrobium sp.]